MGDLKIREFRLWQIIKRSEAVLARVSERRLLRERFAIGEASTKYHRNRGGARRAIYPRLPLVSKLPYTWPGGGNLPQSGNIFAPCRRLVQARAVALRRRCEPSPRPEGTR